MEQHHKHQYSVSVIIPTFNREKTIRRAVDSVLRQTFQDFEIIIVDDGSSDKTREVVDRIGDRRVTYFKLEKNYGQSYARNFGIKKAKYKIVAFQDSDDEWLETKLEKQVALLRSCPQIKVVYSSFIRDRGRTKKVFPPGNIRVKSGNIYQTLLNHAIIGLPTVMIRREVFEKVGYFDDSLRAMEDQELFMRISKEFVFGFVKEPLVIAYGKDNISSDPVKLIPAIELILIKHRDGFRNNPFGESKQYFKLLDAYVLSDQYSRVKDVYLKSIRRSPLYFKVHLAYFIFSLSPNFYKFIRKHIYY